MLPIIHSKYLLLNTGVPIKYRFVYLYEIIPTMFVSPAKPLVLFGDAEHLTSKLKGCR